MQAVIFDMDDTLVVEEASVKRAFLDTCRLAEVKHGLPPNELEAAVRQEAREIWYAGPAGDYCRSIAISSWEGLAGRFAGDKPELAVLRAWLPTYRLEAWRAALRVCNIKDDALAAALADAFMKNRGKYRELFADTIPCLEALRGSYRLGLLTNGAADVQRGKIAATGIGGYFAATVVSGEAGWRKPDGRIFQLILERLGAAPAETWMVGNSLHSDIGGGRAAGLKTAWVNRNREPADAETEPDIEVRNLAELVEKLG